jgi:organic hydroperoxide reductase OsmC/OhrA
MSAHHATASWALRDGDDFAAGKYSRAHDLDFGHGLVVPGSPSPLVVPAPWSREGAVDPEAAFVASLSACHMLWFLDLAREAGFVVTRYRDAAEGTLGRVAPRKRGMTKVVLRPRIAFSGPEPTPGALAALHHEAHERCFIANSVTTEIVVEPHSLSD